MGGIEATMIPDPDETEAIAGLQLLNAYIAYIDFKNKKIEFTTEEELEKKLHEKIKTKSKRQKN